MLFHTHKLSTYLNNPNPCASDSYSRVLFHFQFTAPMSNSKLKVVWRKDHRIDRAIDNDKQWRSCSRVATYVLKQPGLAISLRELGRSLKRLNIFSPMRVFIERNPGLFDVYMDRFEPKSKLVPFVRISNGLQRFLEEEERIYLENEQLIVAKLCKLLMMSKRRAVGTLKLDIAKWEFGFPADFLVNLVPRYPEYFRLTKSPVRGKSIIELVSWNPEFAKSVIQRRAEEESSTGSSVRPSFIVKLPPGFVLKREMRQWVKDWMEIPYVSPYDDTSCLEYGSIEFEKRTVGVFHELLSLSLFRRVKVRTLARFSYEYQFFNVFPQIFTRHSGIFYLSLRGAVETAVLREAYKDDDLIDRDPLVKIKDKFVELLEDGQRRKAEQSRLHREAVQKEMVMAAMKNQRLGKH